MKKRKPIIGITAALSSDEKMFEQRVTYIQAVRLAGGDAMLLPCNLEKTNCRNVVKCLDGLLLPGGIDVDPDLYGENEICECGRYRRFEDEYEMEMVKEAVDQKKPVLAICRGIQLINVLYGGTLYQDIKTQCSDKIIHSRIEKETEQYHAVFIEQDSYLVNFLGKTKKVKVNTYHHQAIKEVADGFKVSARALDGIVEAIENKDASVLGVQWHPERMQNDKKWQGLMRDFIKRCRK